MICDVRVSSSSFVCQDAITMMGDGMDISIEQLEISEKYHVVPLELNIVTLDVHSTYLSLAINASINQLFARSCQCMQVMWDGAPKSKKR